MMTTVLLSIVKKWHYKSRIDDLDCHTRCVRYDIVLESNAGGRIRCQMPHQVTYDVVATPIR
eukprot:scaffold8414_cov103-Skeletonema_marinoi.AAC.4